MSWVDTHCHLQLDERDPGVLLDRASNVSWVVAPGVDFESSRQSVDLAKEFPGRVLPTAGLHPHDASKWDAQRAGIESLVAHVNAIGETGLDYYRNLSDPTLQKRSFFDQLRLADTSGLPIVVHCRDAFADVHQMLEEAGLGEKAILHCWTGGTRWTKRFLDLGVTFSYAGPIAFETGETVRLGAALVPPNRTLVETDTPYLAPTSSSRASERTPTCRVEREGPCSGVGVGSGGGCRGDHCERREAVQGMNAQTRTEIADLLDRHDLRPVHHLGQHFLADPNITQKIVALSAVGAGDRVVEIGAGTGTLTAALATTGATVVAYEVDDNLAPVLAETLDGLGVELRFEDISRVDLESDLAERPWHLIANLPYNVGTPLLIDVLRRVDKVTNIVAMVQREVAERFVAGPGSKIYGLPSVVAGIHGEARFEFTVPPQVFYPVPNVESAVISIKRIGAPESAYLAVEIARAAFGQRRKMLRRSLESVSPDPVALLAACGISETARPEELLPTDFIRLAEASS